MTGLFWYWKKLNMWWLSGDLGAVRGSLFSLSLPRTIVFSGGLGQIEYISVCFMSTCSDFTQIWLRGSMIAWPSTVLYVLQTTSCIFTIFQDRILAKSQSKEVNMSYSIQMGHCTGFVYINIKTKREQDNDTNQWTLIPNMTHVIAHDTPSAFH